MNATTKTYVVQYPKCIRRRVLILKTIAIESVAKLMLLTMKCLIGFPGVINNGDL